MRPATASAPRTLRPDSPLFVHDGAALAMTQRGAVVVPVVIARHWGATDLNQEAPVARAADSGPMTVDPEAGADVAGRDHLGQGGGVAQ